MGDLLIDERPDIAKQFDAEKNTGIQLETLTISSGKKVWWKCDCGYGWKTSPSCRKNTKYPAKCRKCNNKGRNSVPILNVNDMWTTNPSLASLLLNKEDGYKYKQSSNVKLDWKCPDCKTTIKNKTVNNIKKQGLKCPSCSDGKSYPEKFIYYLLKYCQIDFFTEHCFEWGKGSRYDFFIPSLSAVVEVHGIQHYEDKKGRSTKIEQEANDTIKRLNCFKNGVEYIEIDARFSELSYIENSVKHSVLSKYINLENVDYKEIHRKALNSFTRIIADYWNIGKTKAEIIELTNFSSNTVTSYLKKASTAGLCEYTKKESHTRAKSKPILQFDLNDVFIKEWESATKASEVLGVDASSIRKCCRGDKYKSAGGFKWRQKV